MEGVAAHLSSCCCRAIKTPQAAQIPRSSRGEYRQNGSMSNISSIASNSPYQPPQVRPTLTFRESYNTTIIFPYPYNTRPLQNLPPIHNNSSSTHLNLQHRLPPPFTLLAIIPISDPSSPPPVCQHVIFFCTSSIENVSFQFVF